MPCSSIGKQPAGLRVGTGPPSPARRYAMAAMIWRRRYGGDTPYPDGMADTRACLVDVYDTIVSCDFLARRTELATMAGVATQAWREIYLRLENMLNMGRLTKAEGFELIMRECGVDPRPALVRALVNRLEERRVGK